MYFLALDMKALQSGYGFTNFKNDPKRKIC